ncbi:VOC family protein [Streptomyces sp. NPDC020845]|uniref:VOC family protein n=1 Tax=Streptomyces sp. NPDC020845 TaxID=3365096 RepID=UPI0037AC5279
MTEAATRHTPGTPCWTSLMVHSLAATQEFYHALFGWEFTPGPEHLGAYVRARIGDRPVAGLGELPPERHLPVAWTTYLASDDADETAELIRACGGTVAVGPLDAGEAGRMALAADPQGAAFGVWQAREHLGAEEIGSPGSPVWHELMTWDSSAVGKFYDMVFGCHSEPSSRRPDGPGPAPEPGSDALTLRVAGRPVAAIHGMGGALPRDRGPHWRTYFAVADVDKAVRQVTELGGYVVLPPQDGVAGRTATVTDPEGAAFALVGTDG